MGGTHPLAKWKPLLPSPTIHGSLTSQPWKWVVPSMSYSNHADWSPDIHSVATEALGAGWTQFSPALYVVGEPTAQQRGLLDWHFPSWIK